MTAGSELRAPKWEVRPVKRNLPVVRLKRLGYGECSSWPMGVSMRRMRLALAMVACAGVALPLGAGLSGAAAPIGTPEEAGVQPGGEARIGDALCTFNFLFQGSDGNRYMGTAGHCVLGDSPVAKDSDPSEEMAWGPGQGKEVADVNNKRVGEFAYAVLGGERDFSLVRLDPGVDAKPQMAHFGGPTGLNDDLTEESVTLHWYGNGVALGSVLPARTGYAMSMMNPDHVYMFAPGGPGDSGSGVISDDGRAVGVLVAGSLFIGDNGDLGDIRLTRLAPQLAQAEKMTGVHYDLVTAPKL